MARRLYKRREVYAVSVGEREIHSRAWRASSCMPALRSVYAEFGKKDRKLVDLWCNYRRGCPGYDRQAIREVVRGMKCVIDLKLKGRPRGAEDRCFPARR